MKIKQLSTNHYKKSFTFEFKGKNYRTYSTVRLTNEAMAYFKTNKQEVQLIEQFIYYDGTTCWKYALGYGCLVGSALQPITISTDRTPDELIEEVVKPASQEYLEYMVLGNPLPEEDFIKTRPKEWEIPGLMVGWIVLIIVCICACLFKDWIVRFVIWNIAGWYFGFWRQKLINVCTKYEYIGDDNNE